MELNVTKYLIISICLFLRLGSILEQKTGFGLGLGFFCEHPVWRVGYPHGGNSFTGGGGGEASGPSHCAHTSL